MMQNERFTVECMQHIMAAVCEEVATKFSNIQLLTINDIIGHWKRNGVINTLCLKNIPDISSRQRLWSYDIMVLLLLLLLLLKQALSNCNIVVRWGRKIFYWLILK